MTSTTVTPAQSLAILLRALKLPSFARYAEEVAQKAEREGLLRAGGQLVVASLTAPGSVAAAHLNFMLTCQAGAAVLPRPGEIEADLRAAGFDITRAERIVPTEPFLAVTAALRRP